MHKTQRQVIATRARRHVEGERSGRIAALMSREMADNRTALNGQPGLVAVRHVEDRSIRSVWSMAAPRSGRVREESGICHLHDCRLFRVSICCCG